MLRFRFTRRDDGEHWDLFAFDAIIADWGHVPERRCPKCLQSFADLTADELKDRFWPGGMAV
jgi:hypothetical protein